MNLQETIPRLLQNLQNNQQYVGKIVDYCEDQLHGGKETPSAAIAKIQKYVEDSTSSVAENVLSISTQLTDFLTISSLELTQMTKRITSISTRLSQAETHIAHSYSREQRRPRPSPARRFKLRVLTGDELPPLARPRQKYVHTKIDLHYLESIGIPPGIPGYSESTGRLSVASSGPSAYDLQAGVHHAAPTSQSGSLHTTQITLLSAQAGEFNTVGNLSFVSTPRDAPPLLSTPRDAPPLLSASPPQSTFSIQQPPSFAPPAPAMASTPAAPAAPPMQSFAPPPAAPAAPPMQSFAPPPAAPAPPAPAPPAPTPAPSAPAPPIHAPTPMAPPPAAPAPLAPPPPTFISITPPPQQSDYVPSIYGDSLENDAFKPAPPPPDPRLAALSPEMLAALEASERRKSAVAAPTIRVAAPRITSGGVSAGGGGQYAPPPPAPAPVPPPVHQESWESQQPAYGESYGEQGEAAPGWDQSQASHGESGQWDQSQPASHRESQWGQSSHRESAWGDPGHRDSQWGQQSHRESSWEPTDLPPAPPVPSIPPSFAPPPVPAPPVFAPAPPAPAPPAPAPSVPAAPPAPSFSAPPPPGPPGPPGPPPPAPGPPAPPSAPSAPVAAPRLGGGSGGGRADLLASIQAGKALKKVGPPPERHGDGGGGGGGSIGGGAAPGAPRRSAPMSMQEEMAARLARKKG